MQDFKCGYVSIIGRPNVGKSTLLNQFVEQKLSITSRKPQTTRWSLRGIKTNQSAQIIFIDTPGLQKHPKYALNRHMNKEALRSLSATDVILFMMSGLKWTELDENIMCMLRKLSTERIILLMNKVDTIKDKTKLLIRIREIVQKTGISDIFPISAKTGSGISELEQFIQDQLPVANQQFPRDQITDRHERFFAADFLREKLIRRLGDELPYCISVTVDSFCNKTALIEIHATIWVETSGQKSIVIGKNGNVLKSAGSATRQELEYFFDKKINLKTWVRVKSKWVDSEQALKQFGYFEQ